MQKTALNIAAALALATFGAGTAFAQSSLTLYGNLDVSIDHVKKTAGVPLLDGTAAAVPVTSTLSVPARIATQGVKSSVTRVSPSASSQTAFGIKGEENLGDGYKASFVLEGQLGLDNGALSQGGRIFGRQSYVGLTTPFGEVRLGRQYAPIFWSTAFVTTERFGATDLFIEGGTTNNLMVRHDNAASYWIKAGGLTASVGYSPNAGSPRKIGVITTGRNLGAPSGSNEYSDFDTGRSIGMFANYAFTPSLNATFGYHHNEFDGATFDVGGNFDSAFALKDYQAYNVGAKYVFPGSSIMLSGSYSQGEYNLQNGKSLDLQFMVVGVRVPVNAWTFSAQASQIKFKNFTKGKDTGLLLGAEYALSKRTTVYARLSQIKDDEGQRADIGVNGLLGQVAGGPDVIATAVGFREIPSFAGAGINPGGKSTYIGAGVRHSF
ncbi:porin [Aquabacterium sp.]|uniref:porin n=1 Tax=Aquabacterium sp. TaxID=1872578 RepID=UPI00262C07BD|nr:porin [Aquabacterium sp.]MDD2976625.1 porin [Aquabacterium sp.]